MSYFVVGLTNDDPTTTPPVYKQYHHIQYNRILPPSATATVRFPPSDDLFRYVIIQKSFASAEAICLNEVKVFLRGMYALINLFLADRTARSMISYWHVDVRGVYPLKPMIKRSPISIPLRPLLNCRSLFPFLPLPSLFPP